ncbi:MAG TPA: glycosyltransferase family 39 protein [Oculatellaceae cyanobacterium]|jgi:hypothetical protein
MDIFRNCRLSDFLYATLAVVLLAVIGYYYVGVVDEEIIGFTHDDGVYLTTAKALATGQGFNLLHVVGHPAEVKYPFVYPLLLAPIWMLFPRFPENVPLFSYLSIAFTLAAGWLIYVYARSAHRLPGWLALWCIALAASNFFFIYFTTTVMSEAPYLFFSLLTLWFFHKAHEKNEGTLTLPAIAGLIILSDITFLTRVTGLALMAAVGAWLLLNRQWRNAMVYGLGCLLFGVLPWALWIKLQTPPLTDLNYPLVNAYSNYGQEFVLNYFGSKSYWDSLSASFASLLNRMLEDMVPLIPNLFRIYPPLAHKPFLPEIKTVLGVVSTYALSGYFLLQGIRTVLRSVADKRFSPALWSVPALYVFFYILLILFWNYEDQMARFIVVITPLLWIYFFKPGLPLLQQLASANPFRKKAIVAWGLLILISIVAIWPVQNSYRIIWKSRNEHWVESGRAKWLWQEYQNSFAWLRQHTPPNSPLAAASDVVYYLYTERPSFYLFYASLKRIKGHFTKDAFPVLMNSLDHYGVKYLVVEPHMQVRTIKAPKNLIAMELIQKFPERFEFVYSTPREAIHIYRILPPAKQALDAAH